MQTKYRVGLTVPEDIKRKLPYGLLRQLEQNGHGISFPCPSGLQMRYIYYGKDFGGYYPLSKYVNWLNAILSAMKEYQRLCQEVPNSSRSLSPYRGVRYAERYRSDMERLQRTWQVHYTNNGKACFKAFYVGNENTATTERKQHAKLTAYYFRALFCVDGDPSVMSQENSANWQRIKYYDNKEPFDWDKHKRD